MANLLNTIKNKGFSSIGSVVSAGLLVATPLVAMTMIALVISQRGLVRGDAGLGGGNTAGLELVEENVSIYVTTYYPGYGDRSVEGGCKTSVSENNGPRGSYFFIKTSTSEFVDYCSTNNSERARMLNDNDYQLVSVFSADKENYAFSGAAVNDYNVWPLGSIFPIQGRVNNVRSGLTYWLELPGLDYKIPVIDHFAQSTTLEHKSLYESKKNIGIDTRYRFDIAIKAGSNEDPRVAAFKSKIGCEPLSGAPGGSCVVKNVDIYFGNQFNTSAGPVPAASEGGGGTGSCTYSNAKANPAGKRTPVQVKVWQYDGGNARSATVSVSAHSNCVQSVRKIFKKIYDEGPKKGAYINDLHCYRVADAQSRHTYGVACDINPTQNYFVGCKASGGKEVPLNLFTEGSFWKPGPNGINEKMWGYKEGSHPLSVPMGETIDQGFSSENWARGVNWYPQKSGGCKRVKGKRNDFMHYSVDGA